ncbi:LysE family translocator [Streptomyces sp. Tu 3180]|nr:LysE family translocator [Streptomyces sp. Tu 3180]KAF3468525.1 LysE family translocator [Streptomyces sp. Tu 3180]
MGRPKAGRRVPPRAPGRRPRLAPGARTPALPSVRALPPYRARTSRPSAYSTPPYTSPRHGPLPVRPFRGCPRPCTGPPATTAAARSGRAALASVLGNALGGYALVVAMAFGVGNVVARSALASSVIKIAGAAYPGLPRCPGDPAQPHASPEPGAARAVARGTLRQTWEGFTVGVTNPKSIVFLTAVLPQFVDRDAGHVVGQILLLGLAGALLQLASDSVRGLTASAARSWFGRSPRRMSLAGGAGGMTMIGLGVTVAATGRAD